MRGAWYAHTVAEGRACAYGGGKAFVATWRAASRIDIPAIADCRGGVLDCALKVGRFMIA